MKKNKKKMTKEQKNKIIIYLVVTAITLLICAFIVYKFINKIDNGSTTTAVKVDDTIEGYGYTLNDNATSYYKDLFNRLKTTLSTDTVNEKEYATLVGQMFTADFYNLNNKITSSDIGGTEFIANDFQDNFKLAAQNSIYQSIESNVYGNRTQELPIVATTNVSSIDTTKYTYGETTDSKAYKLTVDITYEKDLDYPTSVKLILIHTDKKLEVAKVE